MGRAFFDNRQSRMVHCPALLLRAFSRCFNMGMGDA